MTSREKFEAWYLENWGCTEDNHGSLFEESPHGGEYYRFGVRLAWDSWQAASKASEQKLEESHREFRAADATIHNLELKLTDMAVQLANEQSEKAQLAAENAGMKNDYYTIPALKRMGWPLTPATDAFLAEVRASAKADGVQEYADSFRHAASKHRELYGECFRVKALIIEAEKAEEFAAQLRKGVAL
ncbi:hypothetical protein ACM6O4_08960 [Citrobacter portucalensis]|uniref:hypothetical protein n=1 Tax=Citrobacter portucalensis TaxID=1639133 RepID=UPI0039FC33D5